MPTGSFGKRTRIDFKVLVVRIILISDTFPPISTSGAIQLEHLANEIADQGHALTVLTADSELAGFSKIEYHSNYNIVRVRVPKIKDVAYWRRTLAEAVMPLCLYLGIRKRVGINFQKWDLIVWYSPSIFLAILVWLIKRKVKCKSYLILRDLFPKWALDAGILKAGFIFEFFNIFSKLQHRVADRIGVQSKGDLGIVIEENRLSTNKYEVLPNWLGQTAAVPCSINLEKTVLRGRRVFVYAGNIGKAQGLDVFLELAERLHERQDLGFLFVGRGSEFHRLKKICLTKKMKNVLFWREILPEELESLFSQCYAGIISLDPRLRTNNIPGKFVSYMKAGLPVLANTNPGNELADLIRSNNVGVVGEASDLDELEYLLLKLVNVDLSRNLYSDNCRSLYNREFSVELVVQKLVAKM